MSAPTALRDSIANVPQPPKKGKISESRSFAKLLQQRIYLLSGHNTNPYEEDTRETFEGRVADYIESGLMEPRAVEEAEKERVNKFGLDRSFGYYGEAVSEWFPGNIAVMLRPILHCHVLKYYALHNEPLQVALARIMWLLQWQHAKLHDPENTPDLVPDALGGIAVPGLGTMYGTVDFAIMDLAAFILSCHGRVVGKDRLGKYILEEITQEEVLSILPDGFTSLKVDETSTVFDEILGVSTLFDFERVKLELESSGGLERQEGEDYDPKA